MPILLVRNDITKMAVDAIVNPTGRLMRGDGGTDRAVHLAAGPDMDAACRALGRCRPGEAVLTPGFNLPCRLVIHTVGPMWTGGWRGEEAVLDACYRSALRLAAENRCETLAVPLISTGRFGFPADKALRIARSAIDAFLETHEMTVYLVLYSSEAVAAGSTLFDRIVSFIDDVYVAEHADRAPGRSLPFSGPRRDSAPSGLTCDDGMPDAAPKSGESRPSVKSVIAGRYAANPPAAKAPKADKSGADRSPAKARDDDRFESDRFRAASARDDSLSEAVCESRCDVAADDDASESWFGAQDAPTLDDMLSQIDESFSETLIRRIDERHMTDAECYKRANIDRRLFNKIKNNAAYRPGKQTVLAFAIALRLSLAETKDLLMKAGFALSHSSKEDIVVEYCITHGNYNIMDINEVLFRLDLQLLGETALRAE